MSEDDGNAVPEKGTAQQEKRGINEGNAQATREAALVKPVNGWLQSDADDDGSNQQKDNQIIMSQEPEKKGDRTDHQGGQDESSIRDVRQLQIILPHGSRFRMSLCSAGDGGIDQDNRCFRNYWETAVVWQGNLIRV